MNDCGPRPAIDGPWQCGTCGTHYPYSLRRSCRQTGRIQPIPEPVVSIKTERAARCESCPDLQRRNGGDYCRLDEIALPAFSVCQLRARFRQRIAGKMEECEKFVA